MLEHKKENFIILLFESANLGLVKQINTSQSFHIENKTSSL